MWLFKKLGTPPKVCEGCGCLMQRARKVVEVWYESGRFLGDGISYSYYHSPQNGTKLYCGLCAPPYDMERRGSEGTRYYRKEPATKVEVTKKGKKAK